MDATVLAEIHRYWFGELEDADHFPAEKAPIWFTQSEETDRTIAERWGRWLKPAAEADWDVGALSRAERVGLIVLLDQFPRNIFRESGEAFAYDPAARRLSRAMIDGSAPYYRIERVFLYLPLEHSEAIADQDESVYLFARLAVEAPQGQEATYRTMLDYATAHRDLIRRFGRFPHRNVMLGRDTTEEEAAFLKEHGRGY